MAVAKLDLRDIDFDLDGHLNAGGLIHTYAATSTTPLDTYTDATGGTPNQNPIQLDTSGQAHIWLTVGTAYKFVFATADDVAIYTENGILIPDTTTVSGATNYEVTVTFNGAPTASQWIGGETFAEAVDFLSNWNGSQGHTPQTAATALYTMIVKKNGSNIGTVSVDASHVWSFATVAAATVSFQVGDQIDFFGQGTADDTLADFGFTLLGTLAT